METGLGGKVVLVTGGAGGIGQSICRKLAEEGAKDFEVALPDGLILVAKPDGGLIACDALVWNEQADD